MIGVIILALTFGTITFFALKTSDMPGSVIGVFSGLVAFFTLLIGIIVDVLLNDIFPMVTSVSTDIKKIKEHLGIDSTSAE